MKKRIEDYAKKSLGDSTSYAVYTDQYDPSLLVTMPRGLARDEYGIKEGDFYGVDIWNCHEATFLQKNGLPVSGILKIAYSSSSKLMVESKSMKLFLNSFDMFKVDFNDCYESRSLGRRQYCSTIKSCLESVLGVQVMVSLFQDRFYERDFFKGYEDLMGLITQDNEFKIEDYHGSKNHLTLIEEKGVHRGRYVFHSLRSRCRHTKQKDTGSFYIDIQTKGVRLDLQSLVRHVVSLREVNEFHEFCCEKFMKEFTTTVGDGLISLKISLLYTRRGSLDINPIRGIGVNEEIDRMSDLHILMSKSQFQ